MKKLGIYMTTLIMSIALVINVSALGYGQGKNVDELNRPVDALSFNNGYSKYNAFAINEKDKRIVLTFDQGYENGYTETILDTLSEKGVKAIFFLTGDYVKKEKALVDRIIADGHIIGNHGMKHASLAKLSDNEIRKEISDLHEYVWANYGVEMNYLRPPCGEFTEESLKVTQELCYTTLFWSFAYVDWYIDRQPSEEFALASMTGALHPGAVYLLHSVSSANAAVLGDFIDTARAQGFNF